MGTKIVIVVFIAVYTLFFLSVFGPMHSQKKFWTAIRRIRNVMDAVSYWFFNLCGIATVGYLVWAVWLAVMNKNV